MHEEARRIAARTCEWCGKPLPVRMNSQARFCGTLCYNRYRYHTEKEQHMD